MLKIQLVQLKRDVKSLLDLKGIKFAYALRKNIAKIESEAKELFNFYREHVNNPEYTEYENKKADLMLKTHKLDKNGYPYAVKDKAKYEKGLKALNKKYSKTIKKNEQQEKDWKTKLDEEVEIEFHKIRQKDIPDEISTRQLEIISTFMYDEK